MPLLQVSPCSPCGSDLPGAIAMFLWVPPIESMRVFGACLGWREEGHCYTVSREGMLLFLLALCLRSRGLLLTYYRFDRDRQSLRKQYRVYTLMLRIGVTLAVPALRCITGSDQA